MNPFFYTDFSIPDSLKTVLKSVLIYDTIISLFYYITEIVLVSKVIRILLNCIISGPNTYSADMTILLNETINVPSTGIKDQ